MLTNFASPWNCIYQAAKLEIDPTFPQTHVLGTGPFVFVEHAPGKYWKGVRWNQYFRQGRPYLDGYEADFVRGESVVTGLQTGRLMAGFRSFTPDERDGLEASAGGRISIYESPWLIDLMLVFNTRQPPFDDVRVRRALSLAIDRWGMAERLSNTTFMKFVGGLLRPGFAMATREEALSELPGFGHDIAASRAEARRLLAQAGQNGLHVSLVNRDIAIPYGPGAAAVIEDWRTIGVTATQTKLDTKAWQRALSDGQFDVGFDFAGDYIDNPTLQLAKYVSRDLSPLNYSGSTDRLLDALFIGQAVSTNAQQRIKIIRDFERRALTQAYAVPILWWNRIVITTAAVKGWNMTPSHYIGQELADVWLDN